MSIPVSMLSERRVGQVQVLLYLVTGDTGPDGVERAYHAVSRALAGTPGLLGNALLRSLNKPGSFVVVSEWSDLAAFRAWEDGGEHRSVTAPLRPLQNHGSSGEVFGLYEIVASY